MGAGIFVVVGEVLGEAGRLTPLAYALAAVVAITSALSFAEMGARIPTAGGPIDYLECAFHLRWLGSGVGWVLMAANTVSAATITTGFVAYLNSFASVPDGMATVALVVVLGGVAIAGMKESAWLMTVTTIMGIGALLAVLWALRGALVAAPTEVLADLGIGSGSVGGFVFYILIAMALVGTGQLDTIAQASAPLVKAVELSGWSGWPVAMASLFVIVNGALTQIIAASRLFLDIARDERGTPGLFARVNDRTDTPILATLVIAGTVLTLALLVPLKSLAEVTSFAILIVFVGVNLSLIRMKRESQPDEVPDIPFWVPVVGAILATAALVGQIVQFAIGGSE